MGNSKYSRRMPSPDKPSRPRLEHPARRRETRPMAGPDNTPQGWAQAIVAQARHMAREGLMSVGDAIDETIAAAQEGNEDTWLFDQEQAISDEINRLLQPGEADRGPAGTCPYCGKTGYGFGESPAPSDYCGHDPALEVIEMAEELGWQKDEVAKLKKELKDA